jgi:anti-sigma factor RsiW
VRNDTSIHRQAWDQIPWLINGTLPESERPAIDAHLESCADCREELEFQRRLVAALDARTSVQGDPQMSWPQLRARIDAAGLPLRTTRNSGRRGYGASRAWIPWLVAAMVVQAIGLGVLGTVLWAKPGTSMTAMGGGYRTLSASEPVSGAATIRVVFAPELSVGRMQALLAAAGLQVQSGPSSAGVWSLEPLHDLNRSAATQAALRELRSSAEVRFAEAIGGSP